MGMESPCCDIHILYHHTYLFFHLEPYPHDSFVVDSLTLSLYALVLSVRGSHDLRLYGKYDSSIAFLHVLHL